MWHHFLELNLASPLSGRNIFSSCDKNYSSHGHVDLCTENNFSEGSGIKNFGRETRPTLFTFIQILLKFDNLGGKFELSFIQADLSYLSWKLFYIKTKIKLKGFLAKERGEWRNRNTNIVKLRQGSGKDRQGMAVKVKGLKASTLA